jgi:hypothetical protein
MLIDCTRKLYTVEKEVQMEVSGKKELLCPHCNKVVEENSIRRVPLTVRSVLSSAIQAPIKGDESKSASETENVFDLLMKIHGNPVVELKSDEITYLKDRVVKIFNKVISGQMMKILETGLNPLEPEADKAKLDSGTDEKVNAEEEPDTTASTEEIAEVK